MTLYNAEELELKISTAPLFFNMWGAVLLFMSFASIAVSAEIDFDEELGKALSSAIELEIAHKDILIADAATMETTSKFYPQLYAKYNTDFTYDIGNKPTQTSINNKYYPDSTAWDSGLTIGFQYDFFNFFTDYNAYRYAQKSHDGQKYQFKATKRSIATNLVDIYEYALISYHDMKHYEALTKCALELYNVRKRLYDAGIGSKQLYYYASVEASDYQIQRLNSEKSLSESLEQLAYYTKEIYSVSDTPRDFTPDFNYTAAPDYERYPEYEIARIKLEQKELEISITKGSLFPRFSIYGSYNMFGKDRAAYDKAVSDLMAVNYRVGIAVTFNFFEGFSSVRAYNRLAIEKQKLELERIQVINKINLENKRLLNAQEYLKRSDIESKSSIDLSANIFEFNEALRKANLTGAADMLAQEIETLKKLREQKTVNIRFAAEVKRLEILNKYIE